MMTPYILHSLALLALMECVWCLDHPTAFKICFWTYVTLSVSYNLIALLTLKKGASK